MPPAACSRAQYLWMQGQSVGHSGRGAGCLLSTLLLALRMEELPGKGQPDLPRPMDDLMGEAGWPRVGIFITLCGFTTTAPNTVLRVSPGRSLVLWSLPPSLLSHRLTENQVLGARAPVSIHGRTRVLNEQRQRGQRSLFEGETNARGVHETA